MADVYAAISQSRDKKFLATVLRKGVDFEVADPRTGFTPLVHAAMVENAEAIECLLSAGANVNGSCSGQQTALHAACSRGSSRCVQLLLEAGADVNARDTLLHTPLHAACLGGSSEVVRALLDRDADPNAAAKSGWTPLHRAASKGFTDLCQMLVAAGANPHAVLDSLGAKKLAGATPRSLAEVARHIDTVAFFARMDKGQNGGNSSGAPISPGGNGRGSSNNNNSSNNNSYGSNGGNGLDGSGLISSDSLFQKIAALKASPTVGTSPQVLLKRAAEGHARAKSVMVQKEDLAAMGNNNSGSSVDGGMTPQQVRVPPLVKKPNSGNLLSQTVPEIVITPSSPRADGRGAMSVSMGPTSQGGARRASNAGEEETIPLSAKPPASPTSQRDRKANVVKPTPMTAISTPVETKIVETKFVEAGVISAQMEAAQDTVEELKATVLGLDGKVQALSKRLKQLEIMFALLGVLVIVSILF